MTQTIKHVVVLMLENRSFDHILGFMRDSAYPIDGLTGNESNPLDPHHASPEVTVGRNAHYVFSPDPGHTLADVNLQLYARPEGPPAAGDPNRGFIFSYSQQPTVKPDDAPSIMRCFAPRNLPVITRLAREFAVCDRWFSSVPGPTWPNRFFAHCATSKGFLDNSPFHNYDMPTIFEKLAESGFRWHVYFHDVAQSIFHKRLGSQEQVVNFLGFREFARNAKNGTLPNYAFIEPRYFNGLKRANDQHPPHDLLEGEVLIADVYAAIRSSPAWNETIFLIVYDEHGGFYDHVGPTAATPPDQHTGQFGFDRYGVRVPAIVISPFVPKGTIVHDEFDHASIPATLREVFQLDGALTARDANAVSFAKVAALDAPRTDIPLRIGPSAASKGKIAARRPTRSPPRRATAGVKVMAPPLSEFQRGLLEAADEMLSASAKRKPALKAPELIRTERTAGLHVERLVKAHIEAAKRRCRAGRKRR